MWPIPSNGRFASSIRRPARADWAWRRGSKSACRSSSLANGLGPIATNATEVGFCIEGEGRAEIQGENRKFERYDVWNIPSWSGGVAYGNPSLKPVVWLTYSNAPVLRLLNVHLVENEKTTGIVKPEHGEAAGHPDAGAKIRDLFQIPGDETWTDEL